MPVSGQQTNAKKTRRGVMACDFCRHRKMKCNNERPQCQNCVEHAKHCVYAELPKKSRPTFARIAQLEEDNRRLQDCLTNLRLAGATKAYGYSNSCARQPQHTPESDGSQDASNTVAERSSNLSATAHLSSPAPGPNNPELVQKTFSPDEGSGYHGPTSAVFDEKVADSSSRHTVPLAAKVPEVWVKRQLVAEAANQRQLETVNFLAGKLDYDGVEPELANHLLSIFWNRQQSFAPIVYRPAFMRDMACAGQYFSKLLLNAIYFCACKYSSRLEIRRDPNNKLTAGWSYRQRAVELLGHIYDKSEITTVQALLVMSSVIFSWCDEKSVSWLYAGMAFSMIIDLGIHVDAITLKRRISVEELEIRLRLFWSAYVIDKLQSLYQGRPPCLRTLGTNIPMAFLDDHEELELFSPLSYTENTGFAVTPKYSVSTFVEFCRLAIILDRILQSLYSEKSVPKDPSDLLLESNAIQITLENWRKSLPPHLDIKLSRHTTKPHLPHTLALIALYNVLVILLHRPFVSEGHLQPSSISEVVDAFAKCSMAAFEIDYVLWTYGLYFCVKTTPYILAYANYVSATILVRLAAQRESGSDAHKALRRSLDLLDVHQFVCWSSRRAKRVIDQLITRMGVFPGDGADQDFSELSTSNIDIQAIMRTFVPEQTSTTPAQSSPFSSIPDQVEPIANISALQSPNMSGIDNLLVNGHAIPTTSDEMHFLYDPIFGFGGSVWDDLDLDFTS